MLLLGLHIHWSISVNLKIAQVQGTQFPQTTHQATVPGLRRAQLHCIPRALTATVPYVMGWFMKNKVPCHGICSIGGKVTISQECFRNGSYLGKSLTRLFSFLIGLWNISGVSIVHQVQTSGIKKNEPDTLPGTRKDSSPTHLIILCSHSNMASWRDTS